MKTPTATESPSEGLDDDGHRPNANAASSSVKKASARDPYALATFEEFWPHYVRMHTRRETQLLHACATLSWPVLTSIAIASRMPLLIALAPLCDYAIAQVSHRVFEKNKTTPTKSPLWHSRAELRMLRLVLTGGMAREVRRATG